MPLTPKDVREIMALAGEYPQRQGAAIDALKAVQRSRGWISDADLGAIARLLGMTADELDAVATFYNLIFRRPVGRHVILMCDSVSCWIMGCEKLCDHLRTRLGIGLGETTADGRFTLLPIVCLGACDRAPAMMVDEDLHGDLDPALVDRLLEEYR
jgi:NADH-quinone oxidoreductase subunit E